MNGFLVLVRCLSDDIPALLTADYAEAVGVAREVIKSPKTALDMFPVQFPASTFDHVSVVTIANGRPVEMETIGPSMFESFGGIPP